MISHTAIVFCLVMLSALVGLGAQSPDWIWAQSIGGIGNGNDEGYGIARDSLGNIYVTGSFEDNVTFGNITLESHANGDYEIYVAKMDANGNWLWAVSAGGNSTDVGKDIAIDNSNNVIVTGDFSSTNCQFGTTNLINQGSSTMFVAKLDTNGNWLWAISYNASGYRVAVDNNNDIFVIGWVSFPYGIMVAKIGSSGNWIWNRTASGTSIVLVSGLDVDSMSNPYITGYYYGTVNFGPFPLSSNGAADIYVSKLDTNGNWLWATRAGGGENDIGNDIKVGNQSDLYLTGYIYGSASFGTTSVTSSGVYDIYVAKLDQNGNWQWANHAGGTDESYSAGVNIDIGPDDNLYLSGKFQGSCVFGSTSMTSQDTNDIFVASMNNDSEWLWATSAGGPSPKYICGMVVDCDSNTYITGFFNNSMAFGPLLLTSSGGSDIYIAKLNSSVPILVPPLSILNVGIAYLGYYTDNQDIVLENTGTEDLTIDMMAFQQTNSPFSLYNQISPLTIAPGNSINLVVRFTPQALGTVSDSLCFSNNSLNMPSVKIRVTGTGEIVPPNPPNALQIIMTGNDAIICWEAVTQTIFNTPVTPDYYLIFISSDPYGVYAYFGATSGLQYTHPLAGLFSPFMFYRVVAYKYYGRGAFDIASLGLEPGMPEDEVMRRLRE